MLPPSGQVVDRRGRCVSLTVCSSLKSLTDMLAAARADKMACMAVRDGNEDESEQRIGKDAPCRFYRCNDSRGEHSEHDLEEGGKYFFLVVTPADPGSFVGVSTVTSTIPRLPPPLIGAAATPSADTPRRPPPRTGAAATASSGSFSKYLTFLPYHLIKCSPAYLRRIL